MGQTYYHCTPPPLLTLYLCLCQLLFSGKLLVLIFFPCCPEMFRAKRSVISGHCHIHAAPQEQKWRESLFPMHMQGDADCVCTRIVTLSFCCWSSRFKSIVCSVFLFFHSSVAHYERREHARGKLCHPQQFSVRNNNSNRTIQTTSLKTCWCNCAVFATLCVKVAPRSAFSHSIKPLFIYVFKWFSFQPGINPIQTLVIKCPGKKYI